MTRQLELTLVERHPEICSRYEGDIDKTCFGWGFEHGDGWFYIIENMLEQMQKVVDETGVKVSIEQIKSKFSSLRVYEDYEQGQKGAKIQQGISQIREIIHKAEQLSTGICEYTGKTK